MNKEKNFISAIIYINNDENNIDTFMNKLIKVLSKNFLKYEIICVNDASYDHSIKKIKQIANKNKNVNISIINMSFYQGRELSMNAGVDLSIGDFVYEFDSVILDYDLDIIIDAYKESLTGYDIVNVSPKGKTYNSSKVFYKIFNSFSNSQYKINTESFRIISRRAVNRINSVNKSVIYRKAIYSNCGLKQKTIYYIPETKNMKKINKKLKKDRRNTAIDALILFTNVSQKISFAISIIMMLITVIVAIYTILIFASSNPVKGWTTTMLFMSFGFFTIFAMLTVIIKYLSIIVNLNFKSSKYLIESIDKLN